MMFERRMRGKRSTGPGISAVCSVSGCDDIVARAAVDQQIVRVHPDIGRTIAGEDRYALPARSHGSLFHHQHIVAGEASFARLAAKAADIDRLGDVRGGFAALPVDDELGRGQCERRAPPSNRPNKLCRNETKRQNCTFCPCRRLRGCR